MSTIEEALRRSQRFSAKETGDVFKWIDQHFVASVCPVRFLKSMDVSEDDAIFKYYADKCGDAPDGEDQYAKFSSALISKICKGQLIGSVLQRSSVKQEMVAALSMVPIDLPGTDIEPTQEDIVDDLMCVACRSVKRNLVIVVGCDCKYVRGMCQDCYERNHCKCHVCRKRAAHTVPDFERNKLVYERYGERQRIASETSQLLYDFELAQVEAHAQKLREQFERRLDKFKSDAHTALDRRRKEWEQNASIKTSYTLSNLTSFVSGHIYY